MQFLAFAVQNSLLNEEDRRFFLWDLASEEYAWVRDLVRNALPELPKPLIEGLLECEMHPDLRDLLENSSRH